MADDDLSEQAENWEQIAEQFAAGLAKHFTLDSVTDAGVNILVKGVIAIPKTALAALQPLALQAGTILTAVEEPILPLFAAFVSPIVAHMFGTEVGAEAFASRSNVQGRSTASAELVDAFMAAVTGDSGSEIEPGDEGAKRLAGAGVHAALEGWFNAWILEMLGDMIPWEWLKFKEMTKLPEDITAALGMGRLVRRAIAPLVDATAATPMKWQANRTYRPNLLSEGDIVRAFIRGDYTQDEAAEELARLGYSDKRQDVLLKNAFKNLSLDDALVLERHGVIDRGLVLEMLKAEGYDESVAQNVLIAAEAKRQTSIDDNAIGALTRAYVNRDIDQSAFRTLFPPNVYSNLELDTFETQARLQRDLNVRHLSEGDVIRAVRLEVVPMAYYREWMTREGIPEDEQLIKELLLRSEIEKEFKVDQARAAALAERAAEKAARDEVAKKRQAEIEQERALARRGPISELMRGVVRGLIPPARLLEVLTAQYDTDTVQLFVADAAAQRADYVEQQQKADELKHRALVRHVDVAAFEQGVLNDILTLDQFRQAMLNNHFAAADADLLTANLRVRKADYDAAQRKRAEAEARAKTKAIDLSKFEQLVRRGVRTVDQYAALLRSLDFDDAAIADMTELLSLQIADDTKARETRAAAAALRDQQGLSLEQARRAVILELQTVDWFQSWLITNKFTTEAQQVLVAEVRVDLDEARAARAKRQAADLVAGASKVPLSTVARAARLGLITPAQYQQRLVDAGYTDDDIAIELALLTQEIADVQAARAKQAAADQPRAPGVLTLAQMAAAVRAGVRPLTAYQALAVADGLDDDSVRTLVRVLGDELAGTNAARLRREQLGSQLAAKDVNLSNLEAQVTSGDATVIDYHATLVQAGLDPVDAALLTSLLSDEVASAGLRG